MDKQRSKTDQKPGSSEEGRTIVHVRVAAPRSKFSTLNHENLAKGAENLAKGVEKPREMDCNMYWNEDMERILYEEVEKSQKNRAKVPETSGSDQTADDNMGLNYETLLNKLNVRIPNGHEKIDLLFLKQQVFYIMLGIMREEIQRYNANMQAVKDSSSQAPTGEANGGHDIVKPAEKQLEQFDVQSIFKKTSFPGNGQSIQNAAWDFQKLREQCQQVEDEYNGAGVARSSQAETGRENRGFPRDELRVFEEEFDGYDMINVEQQTTEPQKYLQSTRILNAKLPDLDEEEDDF